MVFYMTVRRIFFYFCQFRTLLANLGKTFVNVKTLYVRGNRTQPIRKSKVKQAIERRGCAGVF